MSNFKNIEMLGLRIYDNANPHTLVVDAEILEELLQSAQVVYGGEGLPGDGMVWQSKQHNVDTHQALMLCVEPIKKKTKAEAALELLGKLANDPAYYSSLGAAEAKRILEMKEEV